MVDVPADTLTAEQRILNAINDAKEQIMSQASDNLTAQENRMDSDIADIATSIATEIRQLSDSMSSGQVAVGDAATKLSSYADKLESLKSDLDSDDPQTTTPATDPTQVPQPAPTDPNAPTTDPTTAPVDPNAPIAPVPADQQPTPGTV